MKILKKRLLKTQTIKMFLHNGCQPNMSIIYQLQGWPDTYDKGPSVRKQHMQLSSKKVSDRHSTAEAVNHHLHNAQ